MSDGVKIYGRDEALNARETMTTEQILAAIQRAITTGEVTDEFTAFIEMIKEQNKGIGVKMWLGTQDEFNALEKTESNTIYFVYTTVIKDISDGIQELYDGLMDGTIKVYAATNADEATHAVSADNVSSTINGKAISSIFESDGYTVRDASEAKKRTGERIWQGNWDGSKTYSIPELQIGAEYCVVFQSDGPYFYYATGCTQGMGGTTSLMLFIPANEGIFYSVVIDQMLPDRETHVHSTRWSFVGNDISSTEEKPGNIVEIICVGDYVPDATAS